MSTETDIQDVTKEAGVFSQIGSTLFNVFQEISRALGQTRTFQVAPAQIYVDVMDAVATLANKYQGPIGNAIKIAWWSLGQTARVPIELRPGTLPGVTEASKDWSYGPLAGGAVKVYKMPLSEWNSPTRVAIQRYAEKLWPSYGSALPLSGIHADPPDRQQQRLKALADYLSSVVKFANPDLSLPVQQQTGGSTPLSFIPALSPNEPITPAVVAQNKPGEDFVKLALLGLLALL